MMGDAWKPVENRLVVVKLMWQEKVGGERGINEINLWSDTYVSKLLRESPWEVWSVVFSMHQAAQTAPN